MENYTMKQALDLKKEAENGILRILQAFEKTTGLSVNSVLMVKIDTTQKSDLKRNETLLSVRLDINL